MGGRKHRILPKERISLSYTCICGEENIYKHDNSMVCDNCNRIYSNGEDGEYNLEGYICETALNAFYSSGDTPIYCENIVDKLVIAFPIWATSDWFEDDEARVPLCPTCYKRHVELYDTWVQGRKMAVAKTKSRCTRMKKVARNLQPVTEVVVDAEHTE